jgi:hypothetical protein
LLRVVPAINFSEDSTVADFEENDSLQKAFSIDLIETDGLIYFDKNRNFDLSSDSCIMKHSKASEIVAEI